jgi:hypothetical protein
MVSIWTILRLCLYGVLGVFLGIGGISISTETALFCSIMIVVFGIEACTYAKIHQEESV